MGLHNTSLNAIQNDADIKVGPDILELLSSAMYVDPITIYREYIQNAADAVDEAHCVGVLAPNQHGRVDISIDAKTRSVRIKDNGCGIPAKAFGQRLLALGGSEKRSTSARGFRGVGRLAGLGYARELIFRASAPGEVITSELRWDCQALRAELLDINPAGSIAKVIRSVTSLSAKNDADPEEHFFEVQLHGVVRLSKDQLTSPSVVNAYLAQVAPVPFAPNFRFGIDIRTALSEFINIKPLLVYINGSTNPIYRPHRDLIVCDEKRSIIFESIDIIKISGVDSNVAALAWILHHEYEGALPESIMVKGLRLRTGNIQVGGHALLEDIFPETRFNAWAVGEVHVLDRRIVPNGRRDNFEQNVHYRNLLNHLLPTARAIARRCRASSLQRKWERDFNTQLGSVEEKLAIIEQDSIGNDERRRLVLEVERALLRLKDINQKIILESSTDNRAAMITLLRKKLLLLLNEQPIMTSPLARLPKKERQIYEHCFELIYKCSTDHVTAKVLVDRILMHIN